MSREFIQRSQVFIGRVEQVEWHAREVVKELNDRPHLLVRLEITGPHFPHRAAEPFVRILEGERVVARSWFADISDDGRRLLGYFAVDVPRGDTVEFGYGAEVLGRMRATFDAADMVRRLERERLPKGVVEVTTRDIVK